MRLTEFAEKNNISKPLLLLDAAIATAAALYLCHSLVI